jgi:hypothetical protein
MLANDALWLIFTQTLFTAPLFVVWFVAIGAGASIVRDNRAAGLCLMAAGALEILRLGSLIASITVPMLMIQSGTLGSEGLRWFGLFKGVASTGMVVVSHLLFLGAIYGWRRRD